LLLIDDSMPDLRVLTEIATARGWAVSVAFNGKDGYHKARLSHFDLILLDVNMPELDGFGTCRLLKADPHTRHIPVIFLSAAGEQTNRLDGLLLGERLHHPLLALAPVRERPLVHHVDLELLVHLSTGP
jgi:DNA-binding response OmpR family regulator